jgi:radical SAM protein with 4Fe4S-binding SPASM domain
MNTTKEKLLILNPEYKLRHDLDKTLLVTKDDFEEKKYDSESEFMGLIHPIHAMMLSFFNAKTFNQIITEIQSYFDVEESLVRNTFESLIENKTYVQIDFNGTFVHFPKNLIIEYEKGMGLHKYSPEDFSFKEVNLEFTRLNFPLDITVNFTSKCMTNCIYCYADRRKQENCTIPLKRIFQLIDQAKNLNMRRFDVIGGEFFLYKHWYEVLKKLKQSGFTPFLTTKMAIGEDMIRKIRDLGFKSIQISLDSMVKDNLLKSIQVKEKYYEKIQLTFDKLAEYGLKVRINTILSSVTDSVEDIKSLEHFFSKYPNIINWKIAYGEYSLYLGEDAFKNYKASKNNIKKINHYIEIINQKNIFDFNIDQVSVQTDINKIRTTNKAAQFKERSACSGNLYAMYVLSDGKVTICEELYWNKHFILGNVLEQDIADIWNSYKAKKLFYLTQDDISDDSACKTCTIFDECRGNNYRKICWRDTLKAYGHDKWDYPDFRCPKAPEVKKEIFA